MRKLAFILTTLILTFVAAVATYHPITTLDTTAKPSACQIARSAYENYEGGGIKGADLLDAYQQACGLGPYSTSAGESCDADSAAEQDLP